MRRFIIVVLAMALLAAGALGEDEPRKAEVLELPEAADGEFAILTREQDPMIGPHEEGYLFEDGDKSPTGYADPSITVNVGTGTIYDTWYMYARVKIADPSQIRVMTSNPSLSSSSSVMGHLLAKRVKAVVAVNGVLEADVSGGSSYCFVDGPVLHQGVWKRPSANVSEKRLSNWKAREGLDTLVIDDGGDLRILEASTWGETYEQILAMGDAAVNVINFGPALVVDGEARYGYEKTGQMATHRPAQRMAICQTGPLEYLLITSEGPEDRNRKGLTLDQFVELLDTEFPEIQTAYNLDGGSSSTLLFRKGSEFWAKINCPKGGKKRPLRDLIYFADAWMPDGEDEGT